MKDGIHPARVCVGGPLDGKLIAVDSRRREFRVAVRQEYLQQRFPIGVVGGYAVEPAPESVYIADCIATPRGEVWFWRYDGMSEFDCIAALVTHYATKGDKCHDQ